MFIGFAAVKTLSVVVAGHDSSGGVHFNFHVLNAHHAGRELGVGKFCQKLSSIADFAVVLGVYETVADHAADGGGVTTHLRLVPHALQRDQIIGRCRVRGRLRSLRECVAHNQKAEEDWLEHGASIPASMAPLRRACKAITLSGHSGPLKTRTQYYECHGARSRGKVKQRGNWELGTGS